jgi:hypothetical protein
LHDVMLKALNNLFFTDDNNGKKPTDN